MTPRSEHHRQLRRHTTKTRRPKQIPAVLTAAMDRVTTGWTDSFVLDLVNLDEMTAYHMSFFLYHNQGVIRKLRLYACSLPQQPQQRLQQQQQRGRDAPTQDNDNSNSNSNPAAPAVDLPNDKSDASLQQLRAFIQDSQFLRNVTFSYCELGNDVLAKLLLRQDGNRADSEPTTVSPTTMTDSRCSSSSSSMVQELDLSRNQLQGTRFGEILGDVLVHEMPRLQKLDLQINPLGHGGMLALQSSLDRAAAASTLTQSLTAFALQDLNLRCCGLGNEGFNILADILTDMRHEHFPALMHLNVAYNNIEGTVGGTAVAHLLERHCGLQKLRLSGNALGENGARALAPGLAANNTLEILRLDYCQVGDDGIHAIVNSLVVVGVKRSKWDVAKKNGKKDVSGLKVLTLHSNGFTSSALPDLTRLLNHKESQLEHLNLSTNRHLLAKTDPPPTVMTRPTDDEDATQSTGRREPAESSSPSSVTALIQDFASAVAHNHTLRILSVYDCGMEDHARAMVFLDTLKRSNTTLESLRIADYTSAAAGRSHVGGSNNNKVLGVAEIEAICKGLGRRNQLLSYAASLKGAAATSATIVFGLSRLANEKDGSSAAFQIVRDKLFFPID
jgi:Leucine Rich repeat